MTNSTLIFILINPVTKLKNFRILAMSSWNFRIYHTRLRHSGNKFYIMISEFTVIGGTDGGFGPGPPLCLKSLINYEEKTGNHLSASLGPFFYPLGQFVGPLWPVCVPLGQFIGPLRSVCWSLGQFVGPPFFCFFWICYCIYTCISYKIK